MTVRPRRALLALAVTLLATVLASLLPGPVGASAAEPQVAQLTKLRAASHATYDRVVWEFAGPLPERTVVRRGTRLLADGSGMPVVIAGSTVLTVSMIGAKGHIYETGRATGPTHLVPGTTNVVEVKQSGDFEAVLSYGVGLVKDQRHRVFTLRNPEPGGPRHPYGPPHGAAPGLLPEPPELRARPVAVHERDPAPGTGLHTGVRNAAPSVRRSDSS
jgi:hypothetical protein